MTDDEPREKYGIVGGRDVVEKLRGDDDEEGDD